MIVDNVFGIICNIVGFGGLIIIIDWCLMDDFDDKISSDFFVYLF